MSSVSPQSHKYHSVQPVLSGHRQCMVLELWEGDERSCAHRCTQRFGECDYSQMTATIVAMTDASSLADDL